MSAVLEQEPRAGIDGRPVNAESDAAASTARPMRQRPPARARMAGAAALATAASSMALAPVFDNGSWFWPAMAAVVAVATSGMVARILRAPGPLVVVAQGASLLGVVAHQVAADQAILGILPGPAAFTRMADVLAAALDEVAAVSAPAPTTALLVALVVGGVGAMAVVVDALAVTGRWVALAGLPLLGLYVVPAAVVPDGVPWPLFVIGAVGYLLLLLVDGRQRIGRWGRVVGTRGRSGSIAPEPLSAMGRRIGLIALAAAVISPLALPFLDENVLGNGSGGGSGGSGGRTVATVNPLVSLQRDLVRVDDAEVLRYTTTARGPDYLRMVTLDTFDGVQWQPAVLRARAAAQVADGLPDPPGLSDDVRRSRVTTTIEVGPLEENRLPLPYPATRVDIEGDWRFDEATFNVLTPDEGRTTQGVRYTVTSLQPAPTVSQLRAAGNVPEGIQAYTELPPVTALAGQLAEQVAGDAATPYDAAVALQKWFRGGEFAYDLTVQPRTADPLADFLVDRKGYCQQFAGTFAVMARLLGIPARVNVGFASGAPAGDGWAVTWNDAHAWPELYFEGAGWVRFEPTPGNGGAGVGAPGYAPFAAPAPGTDPGTTAPSGAGAERLNPTQADRAAEQAAASAVNPRERADTGAVTQTSTGRSSGRLPWALAIVALLALAAAPVTRAWRRRRRMAAASRGAVEAAWAEVLDTAADLGRGRSTGSPRAQCAALAAPAGVAGAAERLALAVERSRYARDPGPVGSCADDARAVCAALGAEASRAARLRGRMLPASVLHSAGTVSQRALDALDSADHGWQRGLQRLRWRSAG